MASNAPQKSSVGPGQCAIGAAISGGIALPLYWLSQSIAHSFANKPIASSNPTAVNIAVAVRTLVMGGGFLITGVFAIAAIGLLLLAVQMTLEKRP